jgi:sRNA-binding protein
MEEEMPGREQGRSEEWKMPLELMRANTGARVGEVGGKENAVGIDGEGNPGGIDGRENAKQSKKWASEKNPKGMDCKREKIQKGWRSASINHIKNKTGRSHREWTDGAISGHF